MATVATDQGVVVSIQLLIAGQRAEVVCPMAWFEDDGPGLAEMAQQAVQGFEDEVIPPLLDLLSTDAQVVGLSAECMDNGGIPYRRNYSLGTHVGERTGGCVSQQVAALAVYYPDPADLSPGTPTNTGGNFLPGISEEDVAAEILSDTLKGFVEAFALVLVNGFLAGSSGAILSRSIFAARNGARLLRKAVNAIARDYVGTIRRRLLPH